MKITLYVKLKNTFVFIYLNFQKLSDMVLLKMKELEKAIEVGYKLITKSRGSMLDSPEVDIFTFIYTNYLYKDNLYAEYFVADYHVKLVEKEITKNTYTYVFIINLGKKIANVMFLHEYIDGMQAMPEHCYFLKRDPNLILDDFFFYAKLLS